MALLLSFLMAAFSYSSELPYQDGSFGCFTQQQADRYVQEFRINLRSFGGLELCDNTKDTKKLLNDLYLIENTAFAPGRDHSFIRGFVARENYYRWMRGETRSVNRGHDIPYATAYNRGGHFTMQDGWAVLSTLGRVGTIIHEARHTAGYRHYACNSGPYGDGTVSGCDTSYSQGGSHGVEMEYYARVVLEAKNLHPVYQSMARLMAMGRSNFVFNESPVRKREALLALSDERLLLTDGKTRVEKDAPRGNAQDRLKRTSFGASLFDGRRALAIDLYGPSGDLADDYSYFKLFNDRGVPASLQAVEEVDVGNLRYLAALSSDGRLFSYHFARGTWHAPSSPLTGARELVTRTPSGRHGLFAVTETGAIHEFDFRSRRFGNALAEAWPADRAAFAQLNGAVISLGSDGRILGADGSELPQFSGRRFTDLVNVPLYDTFEVAP